MLPVTLVKFLSQLSTNTSASHHRIWAHLSTLFLCLWLLLTRLPTCTLRYNNICSSTPTNFKMASESVQHWFVYSCLSAWIPYICQLASELQVPFARNMWKKPFHFSRFHEREISAGKHPPTSLLSSHLKKHMLHLGLVTTEITTEFWKALGQYLSCTNREETQSSVNSTTNSYISLCEQQEKRLVLFFCLSVKIGIELKLKKILFSTQTPLLFVVMQEYFRIL